MHLGLHPVLPFTSSSSASLQFLDGATLTGIMALNKITRKAVAEETHIYTVDNPKFIHGDGAQACACLPPCLLSACCLPELRKSPTSNIAHAVDRRHQDTGVRPGACRSFAIVIPQQMVLTFLGPRN